MSQEIGIVGENTVMDREAFDIESLQPIPQARSNNMEGRIIKHWSEIVMGLGAAGGVGMSVAGFVAKSYLFGGMGVLWRAFWHMFEVLFWRTFLTLLQKGFFFPTCVTPAVPQASKSTPK